MGYVYAKDLYGFAKINADDLSWVHGGGHNSGIRTEASANLQPVRLDQEHVYTAMYHTLYKATKEPITPVAGVDAYLGDITLNTAPLDIDRDGYIWVLYSPDGSDSQYIQRLDPTDFSVYQEITYGPIGEMEIINFQVRGNYVVFLLVGELVIWEIDFTGVLSNRVAESYISIVGANTLFWHPTEDLIYVGFTGEAGTGVSAYTYDIVPGDITEITLQHTYSPETDESSVVDYVADAEGNVYTLRLHRLDKFTSGLTLLDSHMRTDSYCYMRCMAITPDDQIVIYEEEVALA